MAISIIIPAYNRASIIGKTLESIINQTSNEWECIVVDDYSVDDTKSVVKSFCEKSSKFSYYLNERKKGAQGARNTGLGHAKYDWVIFFDSDNTMHPEFVETFMKNLRKDIDVLACCSDIVNVETGRTGRVMNPRCNGYIHDKLFTGGSYVDFNQAVIRKSKVMEIGGLDEDCPSMQEWDTHIRLSKNAVYSMIEESLIDYYQGGTDAISSNTKREVIGRLYILRKHNKEWKCYFKGLTSYCSQILNLINKNDDPVFVKEKTKELRSLVPYYYLRLCVYRLWNKVRYNK